MGGSGLVRGLSAVAFAGVAVNWVPYSSTVYPYTVRQPSSFRHVVYTNTAHQRIDYFSPSLGSATTDVSIFATPGNRLPNPRGYLRDLQGSNVRGSGSLTIEGRSRRLIAADFSSFGTRWTVEQASFVAGGMVWRLSLSYEPKYRRLRPIMVKMLRSFRLR